MKVVRSQVDVRLVNDEMYKTNIRDRFEPIEVNDTTKWDVDLKKEIIYWGQYDIGVTEITKEYAKNNWESILNTKGVLDNLYYIDKETAQGKEKTYLYDAKVNIVYKISKTRIGKHIVHSIEELDSVRAENVNPEELIKDTSRIVTVGNISYYEPDLSGFAVNRTSIVYYDEALQGTTTVPVTEYLKNGKQRTIVESGETYEFYNYQEGSSVWANIVVKNNGMQSYWVWVPRYAYKITGTETEILFIDMNNKQADGSDLPNDYIVHPAFGNNLKGIWVSKYEPVTTANEQVSDIPYYLPDMTGFDENNTYIEVYNEGTESFEETKLANIKDLTQFAKENNWFNYNKKVWANIKVYEPESKTESWWVWIPRYAYSITGENTSIIFIDTNNKPLDGKALPTNYIVHPAFGDDLKGIWVSKYEPVLKVSEVGAKSQVNPPDMSGYNVDNTYIECYDEKNNKFTEQTLRSILSDKSVINSDNVVEKVDIDYSKIKGTWYSYDKRIWANIKIVDPESKAESWWVWIPRYAYNITGIETSIIYIDSSGKPLEGGPLPSNYIPHPAFNEATEGIWASKYEPIEK